MNVEKVELQDALALLPDTPLIHTMTMHENWPRRGKNIGRQVAREKVITEMTAASKVGLLCIAGPGLQSTGHGIAYKTSRGWVGATTTRPTKEFPGWKPPGQLVYFIGKDEEQVAAGLDKLQSESK